MMQTTLSPQEIIARGDALYLATIKDKVEGSHDGKYLVLDIDSGEYEIDTDDMLAQQRLQVRKPQGILYGIRIGSPATYFIGGGTQA